MTSLHSLPMINVVSDVEIVPEVEIVPDLAVVPEPSVLPTPASRRVMALLAGGVPLSLLVDLADPDGPPSADIASSELGGRSLVGDLLEFRTLAAEGAGARARSALRNRQLG